MLGVRGAQESPFGSGQALQTQSFFLQSCVSHAQEANPQCSDVDGDKDLLGAS